MKELSTDQIKKLKSLAHHLKPVVLLGKKGITGSLINAVDMALKDHELIKVKFVDLKEEKRELIPEITVATGAFPVSIIGNVLILYRENPDRPDSGKIRL